MEKAIMLLICATWSVCLALVAVAVGLDVAKGQYDTFSTLFGAAAAIGAAGASLCGVAAFVAVLRDGVQS